MKKFSVLKLRRNLSLDDVQNALLFICKQNCSSSALLNDKNKTYLSEVLFELKKFKNQLPEIIRTWLMEDVSPPLELLYVLEKENLLKTSTYFYFHPEYCSTLNYYLEFALQGDFDETEIPIMKSILLRILSTVLVVRNCNDFRFLYEEIIVNFVSEAISSFETKTLKWNYFEDLKGQKTSSSNALREFALLHLEKFLNSSSDKYELTFVIGNHTKLWSSYTLTDELKSFIHGFLSEIDPEIVITKINNIIHQESYNWKNLLLVIALFVKEQRNAERIKGNTDKWFLSALQEKDKTMLYTSLVVARHCCHEKARYFLNYPTWFGSLSLKAVPLFTFFFECLSQIVPDEPALYLKIHVNKVPSAPASCQRQIVDYLALAKTRLSDLNETTDYIGLFNDYYETDQEGQESDVQRAIKLFQDTKEIPKPLLEASVFRRMYYEKVFLTRLLSVSANEDEKRAELIKKLYSAGKIPSTLYRSWSSRSLDLT